MSSWLEGRWQVRDADFGQEAVDRELRQQAFEASSLRDRLKGTRILSTRHWHKIPLWAEHVDLIQEEANWLSRITSRVGIPDLSIVFRLTARARQYDLVLVSGGERGDMLYLALSGIIPWFRVPNVIVDAHWQKGAGVKHLIQKLIVRLGDRNVIQVQPHTEEEVEIYHRLFSIPLAKLKPVSWSTTLTGYKLNPTPGDFVLTGGASYRDYPVFFQSLVDLNYPVEVGLPRNASVPIPQQIASKENIRIHTSLSKQEYYEKVAACKVFALPIVPGLTRATGDQTILNAMAMGKIVIVTDSIIARSLIRNGENGIIVPESDSRAWTDALQHVYSLSESEYERIARRARFDALVHYNEQKRIGTVLAESLDALNSWRGARN